MVYIRILLAVAMLGFWLPTGKAQQPTAEDIDPAEARMAWLGLVPGVSVAAAPYILTVAERNKFQGTFGMDLSHYIFDISAHNPKCKSQDGYAVAARSCRVDWDAVEKDGIRYVYSKASDAEWPDLSFPGFWRDLEKRHEAKGLYRGAFHFFRPGTDPEEQADAFLTTIGAADGARPESVAPRTGHRVG
jgi:hypothetical protein